MYKHIYTSVAQRYVLDKKIQEQLNNSINDFLKKIELSLLYNSYPNLDKKNNNSSNNFEQLKDVYKYQLIKNRINNIRIDNYSECILKKDKNISKKILISLYEYYLREELVEYTDFWNIDKISKEKKVKLDEDFKTFLEGNNKINYIEIFDKEVENIINNKDLLTEIYTNRPAYFLLYRIRNNILKEVGEKNCSEKHIRNMIKDINKQYRLLYLQYYNETFFSQVKEFEKMKEEIFQHIEEGIYECIRNGKIVNTGNELVNTFKKKIRNNSSYQEMIDQDLKKIRIEDGFIEFKRQFEIIQEKYYQLSLKYVENKDVLNKKWLKDDFSTFILFCSVQYIVESNTKNIEVINKELIIEIENKIIKFINTYYLRKSHYDCFVRIDNIELDKNNKLQVDNVLFIKNKELKSNIDFYIKHSSIFEKDFFEKESGNDQDIYAIVKNVETFKGDINYVNELAIDRINSILNIIYFYTSREKTKKYNFSFKRLIVDNNSNYRLIKVISNNGLFNLKFDDSEWVNKILDNSKSTIKVIDDFNNINIEKNDYYQLINSNIDFLDRNSNYEISRIMAILIAGTNVFKYNIKYIYLRFWLLEDYMEFLNKELPYDDFIMERFLTFYKRALNIILSYNDISEDCLIEKLQLWILKIFPNDYLIKEGI